MAITTGKVGSLYIIDTSTAFSGEATTETGSTKLYTIDDGDKDMWDPNTAITINTGAFDRSYMDAGVNWFEGKVTLLTTGATTLTVTGAYITLKEVTKISNWSMATTIDVGETTEIGDTWKTNMALAKSATLTLSRYRFDTVFDHVSDSDMILIKLFEDADSGFWCKCLRTSIGYTKAINAVDTDALSFVVSSPIAYFS